MAIITFPKALNAIPAEGTVEYTSALQGNIVVCEITRHEGLTMIFKGCLVINRNSLPDEKRAKFIEIVKSCFQMDFAGGDLQNGIFIFVHRKNSRTSVLSDVETKAKAQFAG